MGSLYWGLDPWEVREDETVANGQLHEVLARIAERVYDRTIQLDTEASGLFVDGDWMEAPQARVSTISMTWDEIVTDTCGVCYGSMVGVHVNGPHHPECGGDPRVEYLASRSIAIPFDQGWIGGKPGRWSEELDTYELLPHTDECSENTNVELKDGVLGWECICAPWNFSPEDWAALCEWLKQWRIDFHNAKYDLHIMNAGLRTVPGSGVNLMDNLGWDTMLAQGLICPLETSSLKPTAERLFGEDSRDEEYAMKEALKKNGVGLTMRYDLLHWRDIGPYAAKDTYLTNRLKRWQMEQINSGAVDAETVRHITGGELGPNKPAGEMPLAKLLFKMELRRAGVKIPEMREATAALLKASKELSDAMPFQPVNVNSAKRYFFSELGITPIKVTDVCQVCTYNREKKQQRKNTKKPLCERNQHVWTPSLDTEVAARLAQDKVPYAAEWVQLAQIESALSKWYKAWPYKAVKTDWGWRLMTNFRQGRIESDKKGMKSGGAISGRLSAERVQLQGFPDDYRIPSFVTPPKKLLVGRHAYCEHCQKTTDWELHELDISNAEVRGAAWLMQSKTLADACASGNVHSANTVIMFGEKLKKTFPGGWPKGMTLDALLVDEAGEPILDKEGKTQFYLSQHPQWGMYRKVAKTTILGLFFGAGKDTLKGQIDKATESDFPMPEVMGFIDMTMKVVPELQGVSYRMQRKADKRLGGPGYIKLVNGRKRWFGWAERTHKAFNQGTQGGIAETMKVYMLLIEQEEPGALINQVHDSAWLEMCGCRAEQVITKLKAIGEKLFTEAFSTPDLPIPFELDSKRLA